MSPSFAHEWLPTFLKIVVFLNEKPNSTGTASGHTWAPKQWRNLYFRNPVGIAGGVDKTGQSIDAWWNLGAGFLEIGTVTPYLQLANSGKIIDRFNDSLALWNKMGFPNPGSQPVFFEIEKFFNDRQTPIFVNIGKNRSTSNSNAHEDYLFLMRAMANVCDAYVVNISSPNTEGLRRLFSKELFKPMIEKLGDESRRLNRPVLLKLSPDESDDQLEWIVKASYNNGIDGFVISNTTLQRPATSSYPVDGGLSGKPMAHLSMETLKTVVSILGPHRNNKLIINAGGISTGIDLKERLALGADLCQIYSSMVFRGPFIFKKIAREYLVK